MIKHITKSELSRAKATVKSELETVGIFKQLESVEIHRAYWMIVVHPGTLGIFWKGSIWVNPIILKGWKSTTDLLRHEYGHAFLAQHPGLLQRWKIFGSGKTEDDFITEYASTCREEDFCETFMYYLKSVTRFKEGRPVNYFTSSERVANKGFAMAHILAEAANIERGVRHPAGEPGP